MRKLASIVAAIAVTPMIVAAAPTADQSRPSEIAYEIQVGSGETVTVENSDSPETGGTNIPAGDHETCGPDQQNRCDAVLVEFTGFGPASLDFSAAIPGADYDLTLYASDADGSVGEELGTSGNPPGLGESIEAEVKPGYYLVIVDYFFAGGGYTLDVSLG